MVKLNVLSDRLLDLKDFSRLLPKEFENVGSLEANFTEGFSFRTTYSLGKSLSIFKSPAATSYSFTENKGTSLIKQSIAISSSVVQNLFFNSRSNQLNPILTAQTGNAFTRLRIAPIIKPSLSGSLKNSSRISSELWGLVNESFTTNSGAIANFNKSNTKNDLLILDKTGADALVRLTTSNAETLLAAVNNLGFKVVTSRADLNFIEGYIPISAIPQLEALGNQGLLGVIPVYRPITSVGSVTSQADFIHEADRVRNTPSVGTGFDGTGITIGVLSDSYNNLNGQAAGILSGDLPAGGVNVLVDLVSGGSDEGRAMIELIHDLALGANKAFASAFLGEGAFAQSIRDLANPANGNADVIVDDIVYLSEPVFQDGIIAQAVNEVAANGVAYFSSAGNQASASYESSFRIGADISFSGNFHDFDPGAGVDTRQRVTIAAGGRIRLAFKWDDPFYTVNGVDTDLDIFLLNANTNTRVADSVVDNIANQTPFEILDFTNSTLFTQSYDVQIQNFAGPNSERIKYVNYGSGVTINEFATNSSTLSPHAVAEGGKAVAAVNYFDQDNPANFTSSGGDGIRIFFNPDGTRKTTPEIRQGADFAAIQGTDTTFFGNDFEGNGFPNFFGTSASAPHAAAIAALIKQANPTFTPAQIYARLESTARDIGAAGFDNLTGAGLINAYDAIFLPIVPVTPNFADGFESGGLGRGYETNSFGAGRVQVVGTAPNTGTKNLILSSSLDPGFGFSSRSEAVLRVNTTGLSNIQLSFDEREFSNVDNAMPATFSGSSDSDGVALSVDGTNWFRLISLTGSASTAVYQTNSFNLSTFAIANSLTLGSDVRIKFQQFDVNTTSGLSFDNINVQGTVNATQNADTIVGTFGNDVIDGLGGRDTLTGAAGNDILTGSVGADTLTGGLGSDRFVYNTVRDGIDIITDFTVAQGDQIDFRGLATSLGQTGNNLISLGYLSFVNSGSNAIVRLDQDASGSIFVPRSYITVNGITTSALNQSANFIF